MNFFRKRRAAAEKRKAAAERERSMLRNGSNLLEEMISSFNGESNPIRSFSAQVILKATNNFDSDLKIGRDSLFIRYKGIIEDRPVLVKNHNYGRYVGMEFVLEQVCRDITVSSRMSSHKNVLKLLGTCIEFPLPVLVYEYDGKGELNLQDVLEKGETFPWDLRLKIAKEVANAVTYLHTAFPKRFIHRDIKPGHIFLDENWTAKLSDFSLSIPIPDGEPHVKTTVSGTMGFIEPEYVNTSFANESSDVYSFGVLLLVLITGKGPMDRMEGPIREFMITATRSQLMKIVDPRLVEVAREALVFQMIQAFIDLALICTSDERKDRPSMLEVAKELLRIEKFH